MGLMSLMGLMAHAQFGDYGVKGGFGIATINDDLASKSPVLGANVGGYINYTFAQSQSVLAEIFYLQSGVNLVRRGSNFEEIRDMGNNLMIRTGYYHAWYAQVPILAAVHMELPVRQAGHVVGLYVGPAVSVGLFGRYADRKITPGVVSEEDNYDVSLNGSPKDRQVFTHINRFDVSAILGVSYERGPFTLSLFVDHGFMATSHGTDVIRLIENSQLAEGQKKVDVKIPNGNNNAVMFTVAYRLGSFSR